jgi:hypothetical protein
LATIHVLKKLFRNLIFATAVSFVASLTSASTSENSTKDNKALSDEVYICSTKLFGKVVLTYLHLDAEPRLIFRSPFFGTRAGEPLDTREVIKLKHIEGSGSKRTFFAEYEQSPLIIIMKIFGANNDTIDMKINWVLDEDSRDNSIDPTGQAYCEKQDVSLEVMRSLTSLSEAAEEDSPKATHGVPLTGNEKQVFKHAVQNCWAIKDGSAASAVKVTVAIELKPDGKVYPSSLALIGYEGGNFATAQEAFQAARRAILRCQKNGYDLPANKYDQWRNIEITFDPKQ